MSDFGERRYITLMDADLVGSTSIDVALGQERGADVKLEFRRIARGAIEGNLGTYRTSGDGVFAEFGLTHGMERPVLAAVRAAQTIVRALEAEDGPIAALPLRPQARFGIHCGLTLIRPDERGLLDYFGTTPDVAARLQAIARPNEILLSEDAYANVRHFVTASAQPPRVLKGIGDPLTVYGIAPEMPTVLHRTPALEGAFVGRVRELCALKDLAAAQSRASRPGFVQVLGPGGIGKTRLLRQFCATLSNAAALTMTCDPFSQGTSLGAVLAALSEHAVTDMPSTATVHEALSAIESTLNRLAPAPGVAVLAVDDAQFADPTTTELLKLLLRQGDARLLVVVGAREPIPEFEAEASANSSRCERIVLEPMEAEDANDLVLQSGVGNVALTTGQRLAIVSRAAGVPLYLRELAFATGAGAGTDWRETSGIPAGLWPLLEARLAPNRASIQTLRTLSLFEGPLPVHVAAGLAGGEGDATLEDLEATQLVRFISGSDGPMCAFSHDLVRTAVYEGIAPRNLPEMHDANAATLLEHHATFAAAHPHIVARQFELAGNFGPAADHFGLAGDLAQHNGAYLLAENHYQAAFQLAEGDNAALTRIGHRLIRIQMINHGFGDRGTVGATLARLGALQ